MADVVITQQDIAYAAGFFDGEGCVQLYMRKSGRTKNCLTTALSAYGTDSTPLYWLHQRWGGSIKWDETPKRLGTGRRPVCRWVVFSKEAEVFAKDVRPFLLVKAHQIDIWLEARALVLPRGRRKGQPAPEGVTDSQREIRQDLVDRVKALKVVNGRG
jgi:hypothetical protein